MAVILLNRQNLSHFTDRIRAIEPGAQRQFGQLSLARMFRHLSFVFKVSLEEEKVPDKSNIITRRILRPLLFRVLTNWPKGKLKAPPRYTPDDAEGIETEREKLLATIERFIKAQQTEPGRVTVSEMFGPITLEYWGRIHGVHTNHHLKQFGV